MNRPAKLHMYVGYYDDLRLGMVLAHTQADAAKAAGTNATDLKKHWVRREDLPEGVMLLTNRLYTRPRSPLVDVPWTLGVVEITEDAEEAVDAPPPRE